MGTYRIDGGIARRIPDRPRKATGPTPLAAGRAADALKRAAEEERASGDDDRARVLEQAADIMQAKAFVGALAAIVLPAIKRRGTK